MTNLEPTESAESQEQVLNFSWWLCMLPSFVAIGVFTWRWFQNKSDPMWFFYSVLAFAAGLVFAAMAAGGDSTPAAALGTTDDTTK